MFRTSLDENKKIITSRSNLFKALKDDGRVLKFGVASDISDFEELITRREDFDLFLIPAPEKVTEPNDNIEISLISPVFRNRRYKWRGLIGDDVVTFKVSDRNFNRIIKDIKFPFRDGDIMECSIKTKGEVDYFGDWVKKEIFVTKVHSVLTNGRRYDFSNGLKYNKFENKSNLSEQYALFDD